MKIQVIGASGTGKSTLCRYISEKTDIDWIDTDRYLWKNADFTENYPVEERLRMYRHDVNSLDSYLVSGSVHTWNPQGFSDRELLVLLLLDEDIRMRRLYNREFANFGARMLPGGDHEQVTREFLSWSRTYLTADENSVCSLACHKRLLREAKCKTLELNADQPIDRLFQLVLSKFHS
jgi:adenylate kinase family enzyme